MKKKQWEHIKTIVGNILTLSGQKQEAYLRTVCQNNPDISAEIKELLHSIEESESEQFMKLIKQDHKNLIADLSEELNDFISGKKIIGTSIGSYQITEQIGSGGMGVVFKGEREDGEFHHQVAIKLIKKGVDTEENIRRFKVEREILASLKHPNIAQLYDGGVTKDGVPYLIMEYVEGVPIDRYCNQQKLNINQRLDLFKKICAAVQHAHSKLIVHRDLKTQNIYVTPEGTVKILDFGIAKLLKPELSEITLLETRPGKKMWTPQYAAPEQVEGKQVSTKSDIYALGVLLHKLLTGTYPLDLSGKSITEIEEIIKNTFPQSPSQSLATHSSKQECATNRNTTVTELAKELSGDLDSLVLKAIRKEPEYRYNSVNQLFEDVENYQSGIPLIARKGTWKYLSSKFIRRHKIGLAVTVILLLSAIGFASFYTWRISQERDRAEIQAQKAEQITEFMMGLFKANEPANTLGDTITARELLERGINRTEELNDRPEVQAQMMQVVGQVYQYMGIFDRAESLLEKSLEIRKQIFDHNHPEVADSQLQLAILRYTMGNYNTESLFRNAISTYRNQLNNDHPRIAHALTNQAIALRAKGKYAAAESLFREVLINYQDTNEETSPTISIALTYLGKLLIRKEEYEEAESLLQDALAIRQKISGNQHPVTANILDAQGELHLAKRNYEMAEGIFYKALEIRQEIFDDDHPDIGAGLSNLGLVMKAKEDYAKADQLLEKALSIYQESFGGEDIEVAKIHRHLASNKITQGEVKNAFRIYNKSIHILRKYSKRENQIHPYLADILIEMAELQIGEGNSSRAEPLLREALKIRQNLSPNKNFQIGEVQRMLGICLKDMKRFEEAEPLLLDGYKSLKKSKGNKDLRTQEALKHLISLYNEWGQLDKAKKFKNQSGLAITDKE